MCRPSAVLSGTVLLRTGCRSMAWSSWRGTWWCEELEKMTWKLTGKGKSVGPGNAQDWEKTFCCWISVPLFFTSVILHLLIECVSYRVCHANRTWVHTLSADDVASGKYCLQDVVLPILGHSIHVPNNNVGSRYYTMLQVAQHFQLATPHSCPYL